MALKLVFPLGYFSLLFWSFSESSTMVIVSLQDRGLWDPFQID